jgi:D-alanyl-D-alanine carboxypeptidase
MKSLASLITLLALTLAVTAQNALPDTFITSYVKKNNFNGTILIENKGKITYRKSFGFSNLSFKVKNTPDTRYKIASITKAFTSVMILQLMEQGKINPDEHISKYLPSYKGVAGDKITVKELLNMTSGMHNMDDGTTMESVLKNGIPQYQLPHTLDEMIAEYCSDTLITEPGTQFDYNNADFILLGKIIEEVSGNSYEENLKQKILVPLKMSNSGMLSQDTIIDRLADTYFYRDDLKMLVSDLPVYWGNWFAAGSMYSTADDLAKFAEALFGGKLLKKESMSQMFTSGLGEYGLGVWVYKNYEIKKKNYTIVKRPGSIMGAQAMLFHILETGSTIIILSNTGTVSLDDFAARIAEQVTF